MAFGPANNLPIPGYTMQPVGLQVTIGTAGPPGEPPPLGTGWTSVVSGVWQTPRELLNSDLPAVIGGANAFTVRG